MEYYNELSKSQKQTLKKNIIKYKLNYPTNFISSNNREIIGNNLGRIEVAIEGAKIDARREQLREASMRYRQKKRKIKYHNTIIDNLNIGITNFTIEKKDINSNNSSLKEILELLIDNYDNINTYLVIEVNGRHYTLNPQNINKLTQILNFGNVEILDDYAGGSDEEIIYYLTLADTFNIIIMPKKNKYKFIEGAFFPYYIKDDIKIDLNDYQIFTKKTLNNKEDRDRNLDNCLLFSLRQYGIDEGKLETIKIMVKQKHIPVSDLKIICERLDICIVLHHYRTDDNNHKTRKIIYGNQDKERVEIGYIENHYFLIKETKYTSYSIKNYEHVKHLENFNKIIKKYTNRQSYRMDDKRFINSFDLIILMMENKDLFFERINAGNINIYDEVYLKKLNQNSFESLEYTKNDYNLIKKKEPKIEKIEYQLAFFDFETNPYTDDDDEKIKLEPYLCCYEDDKGVKKCFIGSDCGLKLLQSINTHTILIAHNAKFDYNFLTKYLYKCSEICNGSSFISFSGVFNDWSIKIKDSYKLIPMKLSSFPKSFGLPFHKEYIPYHIYTRDNVKQRYINYDYIIDKIDNYDNKKLFDENIKKWGCIKDDKVDIIEYSKRYCRIDVELLKNGYDIFRKNCITHFNIDINKILTIPSLADKYFINNDCYEGVYELAGQPRSFIEKCIVGGRTMVRSNEKICKYNVVINDFDAVSLYPSAMNRIDGFLKGLPKIITNTDYDTIKGYDGYFIEIEIIKVGIKRKFPLMSVIDDNGIKNFTNDVEGVKIFVDKTSLEDMIKFQNIEFKVIKGYYFNEGFNTKIKDIIRYIFDKRKQLKKEGNSSELIYKLIMNSGYGKTIQKPPIKEIKLFDNKEKFEVFVSRNYNKIVSWISYDDDKKYKVEISTPMNTHFNRVHIGVPILSMSKRIMNEVICIAEDNNLEIYYQDTDSIHIEDQDIKILSSLFKNKYNKELIGNDLGQFHSDFSLNGATKDIIATDSIFLGKKSYIDCLEGYDDNDNKINGYHIRMKGISNDSIMYYCKNNEITPFELYKKLYDGEVINFDLTCGGTKVNFKFNKNYTIEDLQSFNRSVSFKNKN
jgi:DNA polymerase III epsilon subunit-like protein